VIVCSRLLRYLTRNRRIPCDQEARARIGTWAWLNGRDLWRPSRRPETTAIAVIAEVIYEADECPDIFEIQSRELAGDIVDALARAGYRIVRAGNA
jgi:hypothetical protein